MSVQELEKSKCSFALACQDFFRLGRHPSGALSLITMAEIKALPKAAQLLLAYCLEQESPILTLLDDDTEVNELLTAGWLESIPCPTISIISFKVKPHIWNQLKSFGPKFLSNELLDDLKIYKAHKGAQYPWIW